MKKIEILEKRIQDSIAKWACPVCKQPLIEVKDHALICPNGHNTNISKKGWINLLSKLHQENYTLDLFESRLRVSKAGFFSPIIGALAKFLVSNGIHKDQLLVDLGSGEGSALNQLVQMGVSATYVGMDISKEAIQVASLSHDTIATWLVGDIANLPFNSQAVDILLNIFSPINYAEANRVLNSQGYLLKVVPNANYLQEIRNFAFAPTDSRATYDNQRVLQLFEENMMLVDRILVNYQVPTTRELLTDVLTMSPLGWSITDDKKAELITHGLEVLTVDVTVLIGKKKG